MSKATETILALAAFNSWRRGDETIEQPDPAEIGAAIDDAVNLLRRYDELEKDKERLDWLLDHGAVGHFSEWRDAEGGKERTLFRLHSRADIDAARKEGA